MGKFCSNCGKEVKEGQDVCLNCGKALGTAKVISNGKSKMIAGLLGILLGAFGAHNFYLGYNNKAIAQLLITILSFGTLSFVSGIWGLVEGIQIFSGTIKVDAEGKALID